jgi:hypothetical protein
VAKLTEDLKDEAEVQHPKAMLSRAPTATAMAVTRGAIERSDEMPITPPETPTARKRGSGSTEKRKFNPTESVPLKVTGGPASVTKAAKSGNTYGGHKLTQIQEDLDGDEGFRAIAEVTQDPITDGFIDLSPEDTADMVTAMTEGTAPAPTHVKAYDKEKVRRAQHTNQEIKRDKHNTQNRPKRPENNTGRPESEITQPQRTMHFAPHRINTCVRRNPTSGGT